MSEPIKTHQKCPKCGHDKCLTVWEDGTTFCHSMCGVTYPEGHKMEVDELKEVSKEFGGIPQHVLDFYEIKTGVDDDGKEYYRSYKYPHATKYRWLPKDFSKNKGFTNDHLFGMDKFNAGTSQYLTIVEGEHDAAAAYYMLGEKYPVVSLPGAKISEALFDKCRSYIDSFKNIIVATDSDDAGNSAAKRLSQAFPNKVYRVSMTKYKDAHDFLKNGASADFKFAWINREKHIPSGYYNTTSQFTKILSHKESFEWLPTPFDDLNAKVKGLIKGHMYILTGEEGQGKTEILRAFEYNLLKNNPDVNIAVQHLEESKKTTLNSYGCYELNKNLRDPEHTVPEADVEAAIARLTAHENLYLFDFSIDEDPLNLLSQIRYLAVACGCEYFFIDPLQQLAYHGGDVSEERLLTQLSVQMARLCTELNICIVCTTHVNDDGQVRSSRMIAKSASVRIDLKRDHMNSDPDIRNTTRLSVSKNRPMSLTGFAGEVVFDPNSFTIKEKV